ncbi:MAG: tRNA lysidine(34) synthetase TilS [Bacteroidales bacterium]|nr:tRNA lysidine(34) synthetase TilS [Bacteroidales bacterium]
MRILLAVSGGIDSMYLANRAPELFPGARFAVAHCNFHLRGDESDEDERFVRQWCAGHGLECFVRQFDTARYASEKGISIEMAARDLRYDWFSQLLREEGFSAVAVAHNADDNAETLMLNLLRGTGTRGLRGMGDRDGILRPLLGITRAEIRAWMLEHGQTWREDSSNADCTPKRNRIRNEVFPVFERINPSFLRTLGEDMRRFARVDDIAESWFRSVREGLTDPSGAIRIDAVIALDHWEYALWRLVEDYGLSGPTFEKLVALLGRYRQEPRGTVTIGGKVFEGNGVRLVIRNSLLQPYSTI